MKKSDTFYKNLVNKTNYVNLTFYRNPMNDLRKLSKIEMILLYMCQFKNVCMELSVLHNKHFVY